MAYLQGQELIPGYLTVSHDENGDLRVMHGARNVTGKIKSREGGAIECFGRWFCIPSGDKLYLPDHMEGGDEGLSELITAAVAVHRLDLLPLFMGEEDALRVRMLCECGMRELAAEYGEAVSQGSADRKRDIWAIANHSRHCLSYKATAEKRFRRIKWRSRDFLGEAWALLWPVMRERGIK